jgi:hypothetical protein
VLKAEKMLQGQSLGNERSGIVAGEKGRSGKIYLSLVVLISFFCNDFQLGR